MGGRLPTEAEWENAASWDVQTKTKRTFPWGETIDCSFANYFFCAAGDTKPVGSYEGGKSPYGLYDMGGNVLEWVADWYGESYYASSPASDPLGPDTGEIRVLRGGAWDSMENFVRSANRYGIAPMSTFGSIGFRCARDTTP